jgi:hypothetical protein
MSKPAWAFVIIAAFFTSGAAAAQDLPPLSNEYAPGVAPGGANVTINFFPAVIGHPFRATANSRSVVTKPNGAQETHESHQIVVRDGKGRLLLATKESPKVPQGSAGGYSYSPEGAMLTDPVAMVRIEWDSMSKMVMKRSLPTQMRPQPLNGCEAVPVPGRGQQAGRGGARERQVEQLGERTIQGIATVGCRVTVTVPAQPSVPNSQPNTVIDEWWSSPELRINLIHTRTDSHGNNSLERLDEIVRQEPDPAVFEPPPSYKVYDEDAEREKVELEAVPIIQDGPTPVMLAGPWEVQDPIKGAGTQLGIFLNIAATREVQRIRGGVTPAGSGKFRSLDISIYQRTSGKEHGAGFFSLQYPVVPDTMKWDGQRLQLNFKIDPRRSDKEEFSLDVTFNLPQEVWTGTYTRAGVTNQILLRRPGDGSGSAKSNPLVGLWELPDRQTPQMVIKQGCVQIARSADGTFLAWFQSAGSSPFAGLAGNGNQSQPFIQVAAGRRWGVTVDGTAVTLDEGTYMSGIAGMLPRKFVGKLSADGSQIVGTFGFSLMGGLSEKAGTAGENSADAKTPPVVLTRTTGESCSQVIRPVSPNMQ